MSQDPYPSELPYSGRHSSPYDGGAYGSQGGAPYPPTQPYQGGYQPGPYQSSYQSIEGEKAAQLSLILGIVGLFVAGIVLGPLAIWQARKAERLGVPATAGKVLGWINVVLYGLAILFGILLVVLMFAGFAATSSYST
ncbi:DUF4190 domain-containing protein [Arthrobacter sp. TmT3-37]